MVGPFHGISDSCRSRDEVTRWHHSDGPTERSDIPVDRQETGPFWRRRDWGDDDVDCVVMWQAWQPRAAQGGGEQEASQAYLDSPYYLVAILIITVV